LLLTLLGLGMLQFAPVSALVLLRAAAWSSLPPLAVAAAVWLLSLSFVPLLLSAKIGR